MPAIILLEALIVPEAANNGMNPPPLVPVLVNVMAGLVEASVLAAPITFPMTVPASTLPAVIYKHDIETADVFALVIDIFVKVLF